MQRWLENRERVVRDEPMFEGGNTEYDIADRGVGVAIGGIGLVHKMVQTIGLDDEINSRLSLLTFHFPYHESDHVLNVAYNSLCGGTCLEDIELLRNDEGYFRALGTTCIPDPTTAGDFCRRFSEDDVETLMDAINETRLRVWKQQPDEFFDEAIIDADGTLSPTWGQCKEGMDVSFKGTWGYHPLLVSLSNTKEPLFLVNRPGNRPSEEGAASRFDQAIELCRRAGFRDVTLRGDTAFSQAAHLDRWDTASVGFVFGFDAKQNLKETADSLPKTAWNQLERSSKYETLTEPRQRPKNVKEEVVEERGYKNICLVSEWVAEFEYSPTVCEKTYRMVVLRKNLEIVRGQTLLSPDTRYFFYITNDRQLTAADVVFRANARCDQENLIEQLKNEVHALRQPVDNLVSNWAYMVMASLAWTLKAWLALHLPEVGRWKEKLQAEKKLVLVMEFKKFINAFIRIPALIVKGGRRIIFRLLAWNPLQHIFIRAVEVFERPPRC